MRIFFLFSLFCAFNSLTAGDLKETGHLDDHSRINQLLPNTFYPLHVAPALPADFVAMSPNGDIDLYDWVYWGPKNVLEAYFKNPNSLKSAIIRVKFSENVAQTSPNTFGNGIEEFVKQLKQADPQAVIQKRWGQYPVIAIKERMRNKVCNMAWVGLNVPEAGWTLIFNLIYSENKNEPSKEDETMWYKFINETKPLKN
jgi:hypothetical protein